MIFNPHTCYIIRQFFFLIIKYNSSISILVSEAIEANPQAVLSYRAGKTGALGFLVGQVMRETKGKANPKLVNRLVKRVLDSASSIDTDESAQLD